MLVVSTGILCVGLCSEVFPRSISVALQSALAEAGGAWGWQQHVGIDVVFKRGRLKRAELLHDIEFEWHIGVDHARHLRREETIRLSGFHGDILQLAFWVVS